MTSFQVKIVATKPFAGQKPGTSGLRKKVAEVVKEHYLENFVQCIFDSVPELQGGTLVLGGDGRYHNDVAAQLVIRMAAANNVKRVLVAKDAIFSTPAISASIRARKATGAVILTASHNPGGKDEDFGIKYNCGNGGPAPEKVTDAIYAKTLTIENYKIAEIPDIDLSTIASHAFGEFTVEVIDALDDYVALMKQIFDFDAIRRLLAYPNFNCLFDSLNGVNGPFARRIFVEELGAKESTLQNGTPKPDFGGSHPDPNLVYAAGLVKRLYSKEERIDFGCAWDGDADRNMILGHEFFVTPSDSVALIAANAQHIPYYAKGLGAVARSMPTSGALDKVAQKLGLTLFEVPTGWKYFGNLMDKYELEQREVICGEESFGTGSSHIREKDGTWAVLAWLSILAQRNPTEYKVSVADIVTQHWEEFGRNYYSRYDYENYPTEAANNLIKNLISAIQQLKEGDKIDSFTVKSADEFEYKDPVDLSVSSHQGIRIIFSCSSRLIVRLSGTGASGATIRVYFERLEAKELHLETAAALKDLVATALKLLKVGEYLGTEVPTVIT